jgi:hypothetical protein
MHFARTQFGLSPLGATPVHLAPGGGATAVMPSGSSSGGIEQIPLSPTGAPLPISNAICTSDGVLMQVNMQWRIASPTDTCTGHTSFDWNYVYKTTKQPIFVGPFGFNPSGGMQVTRIDRPDQIPKNWVAWLNTLYDPGSPANVAKIVSQVKSGVIGSCYAALAQPAATGPCNVCPSKDVCTSMGGPSETCHDQTDSICTTWRTGPNAGQEYTYDNFRPQLAAANQDWVPPDNTVDPGAVASHSLQTVSLNAGPDPYGSQAHTANYPGDSNTYTFYSPGDWMNSLGLSADAMRAMQLSDDSKNNGLARAFSHFGDACTNAAQFPPDAKFINPADGLTWGLWVRLVRDASASDPGLQLPLGSWNTNLDRPMGYHIEVGFAPYDPSKAWWCDALHDVLEALFYVPALLFDGIDDIVQAGVDFTKWLNGISCDITRQASPQQLTTMANNGGYYGALAAAAVSAAQQMCGSGKPNCADPKNAQLPGCVPMPISTAKPWWQQWYVLVPALALVSFGIFKMLGPQKKPAAKPAQGATP